MTMVFYDERQKEVFPEKYDFCHINCIILTMRISNFFKKCRFRN